MRGERWAFEPRESGEGVSLSASAACGSQQTDLVYVRIDEEEERRSVRRRVNIAVEEGDDGEERYRYFDRDV